jgi:hypothetical protein
MPNFILDIKEEKTSIPKSHFGMLVLRMNQRETESPLRTLI